MNFLKRLFSTPKKRKTGSDGMPSNNIAEQYLNGLKERLPDYDKLALSYASGASEKQLETLKLRYPGCPQTLLYLLQQIDGTYWREYGEHTITVLILGSDVFEYPYYLKSVNQILEENRHAHYSIREIYNEYIDEMPELIGKGIDPDIAINRWLCFSDCMNNGGTSQLYIDFNPSTGGHYGQIVRYLHDPDSYKVIARNFDEYLQTLIAGNYAFIHNNE